MPGTELRADLQALARAFRCGEGEALLARLGKVCREQGHYGALLEVLEALDAQQRRSESVLYWRLSCAVRVGSAERLRGEVEAHLRNHDAPELRALYAGTLCPLASALEQSRRAYHEKRTPLTLLQYGRLHPDAERSLALLRESVGLAERLGEPYDVVRSGGALLSKLIHSGSYREAVSWGAWVVAQWQSADLNDPLRHMLLINDYAYARLLSGELGGLADLLGSVELERVHPEYAQLFQGTKGDALLAGGDLQGAMRHYRANFGRSARPHLGATAVDLVRGLLESGEEDAALEVAERALYLTRGEADPFHLTAQLALGMARSSRDPQRAQAPLGAAFKGFSHPLQAFRLAQAGLHLAWAKAQLGDRSGARRVLNAADAGLDELSYTGFRLLFALPGDAANLWELVQSRKEPLGLYLLGRSEAWLRGERVPLRLRELEILLLLTLHPEGVTLERLHQLLGEPGGRGGTKTAVSRLRRRVPITASPYRLGVGVYADVLVLEGALKRGDLRAAVLSYRGELLAASSAPGVTEARTALEAALQGAVLASGDVDALSTLAERTQDDLKLWEALHGRLEPQDSRAPVVRARLEQLRASWER